MHTHTQAIEKHEKLTNKPTKKQTRGRKEKRHDLNLITQRTRYGKVNQTQKRKSIQDKTKKKPQKETN